MKALIIVDVQVDFLPGGALAVPRGNEVIPVINEVQNRFERVLASQDWHPPGHMSFASRHAGKAPGDIILLDGLEQVLWPDHCIQQTRGSEFAGGLKTGKIEKVFRKGEDPQIDSYSAFFDNGHRRSTGLGDYLRKRKVDSVYVCGLAAEYCVKYTVLDGLREGFEVSVIQDAVRGLELQDGNIDAAFAEMRTRGARLIYSNEADSESRRVV